MFRKTLIILAMLFAILGSGAKAWGQNYQLVTSTSDLVAGCKYLIGNSTSGEDVKFMSTVSNANNRKVTSGTVSNDGIVSLTNEMLVLELGGSTGEWTLKTTNYLGTNGYLASASSGNNNHCRVIADETTATISFSGNAAVITIQPHTSRNILRYNSSASCFACYSSGQSAVYLYKEITSPTEPTCTIDPTSHDFGEIAVGENATFGFTVTTANLTEDLTLAVSEGFSVSPATIESTETETTVTVTCAPTAVGALDGTLTIYGGGLTDNVTATLSATGLCTAPETPLSYETPIVLTLTEDVVETTLTPIENTGNGGTITYELIEGDNTNAIVDGNTFMANAVGSYTVKATQDLNGTTCGGTFDIVINVTSTSPTCFVDQTEWDFGNVAIGTPANKTFTVTTANLTGNLTLYMYDGSNFSVSPTTIEQNATETEITVTCTATTAGELEDILTISGGGLEPEVEVLLSATGISPYTVTYVAVNGDAPQAAIVEQGSSITLGTVENVDCNTWQFAGWSESENSTEAPTLMAGDEYTPTENVTLYAVYVKQTGASNSFEYVFSEQGFENAQEIFNDEMDATSGIGWSATTGGSNTPKYYDGGTGLRVYNGGSFNITTNGNTITNVTLTFSGEGYTFSSSTPNPTTWSGSQSTNISWSVSRTCRLQKVNVTYSNLSYTYSTDPDCSTPVAAPTFNPAADTYYEDKTIELSAEDGCTIYYTLDNSDPTAESTEYSTPIQLAVPSTTTIKAIAVDGEGNSSNVASATYTLKRSQYTPAQLLAEVEPDDQQYTVVFTNEIIKEFYVYKDSNAGFYIETTEGDFLVYKSGTPSNWEVGGKVSGIVIGTWKTYSDLKEFCPANYDGFSYTQPTQKLPTPTNLAASELSMSGAKLSWDAVEHASSYTVNVTDANEYDKTYTNITENSKDLDNLTAGTKYSWTVKAIDNGGTYLDSDESEPADFTTPTTVLYNVTIVPADGGTIKAQIDGEDITQAANGATVNLVANPNTHFTFTSWDVYKTGDESTKVTVYENEGVFTFTMPDYNVTITATFTEDTKYTVTYDKGGENVTGDDPETVSYYEDDVVILAENPYTRIGFTFNGWEVKDAEENDVTVDDGMFEMPASNVTVAATWAEKTPATITLMDKGEQYGETINGYIGDNLLATLTAAEVENPTGRETMPDYEFAGWAQSNSTETPNIVTEETTITGDATLYAIYANVIPGTTTYQKVNSLSDIVTGRWVIVNDGYALPSTTTGSSTPPAKNDDYKVTVTDNQISSTVSASMIWNFAISEGKAIITNSDNNYLYATDDNNGLRVYTTNDTWTFETNLTGFAMKESSNSRYCATYKSGSDWRSYTSKDHSNYGDSGILYLYKENTTPDIIIYDFEESAKIYTVTYDANGAEGEVPTESQLFAEGDEYTLASAEDLTKAHHTFAGWKANTDEQTYAVGSTYMFGEANVIFTAQWSEDPKFTVSYHANGVVSSEDVFAGEIQLTAPANVPNGYSYVGWTTTPIEGVAQSATYFSSYNVTEDVDLYAVFAIAIGGGTTSVTKDIIAEAGITASVTLNETAYQIGNLPIQLTATKGTNNWPIINYNANNGNDLRFYKSSSSVTFATTNNSTITKIEFKKNESTASDLKTYFSVNVGTLAANVWTGSAGSVTITYSYATDNFKEQMYIINVTYSENSPSTFSNFCTTVELIDEDETISENATWEGNYTINGHIITIGSGAVLTVNGALGNTNADNLIIEDGGQLIFNNSGSSKDGNINSGVKATVKKVMDEHGDWGKSEKPKAGWYFLAAPMTDFAVTSFTNQAGNGDYDLYRWYIKDDGTPIWYNYKAHDSNHDNGFETNFVSGRGYLAAYEKTNLLKMQGTLNAGTTFSFTEELNSKDNFTLLGNPFTYDLKWSKFDNKTGIYNGFAVVDSEDGIIKYAVDDTPIKVGTGFMVYTEEEGATLSFDKNSGSGKSNDILALNLFASNGNGEDNTIIVIDDNNGGFAKADNFNTNVPQIYTERLQTKYGIRNFSTSTKEFNVSFKAAGEGSNTIRLETIGEFDYVHLYDKLLDVDVDMLLEGSYTFEASDDDNTHRFIVRIDKGNTGINENESESENFVSVYNGEIHVSGSGKVQIFDVMGRMVHSEVINGDATISTSNIKGGVYVVRLIGDGWTKAEKIVVRR